MEVRLFQPNSIHQSSIPPPLRVCPTPSPVPRPLAAISTPHRQGSPPIPEVVTEPTVSLPVRQLLAVATVPVIPIFRIP